MPLRPTCKCHGEPMHMNGFTTAGNQKWNCSVKNCQLTQALYNDDPLPKLYQVAKYKLGRRIRHKRARIAQLEDELYGIRSP